MLKTNRDKLPIVSVQGKVWPCRSRAGGKISADGEAFWLQGVGGITYNAQIGDCCLDWLADHLEPGVTARHMIEEHNTAFCMLSCIGNVAEVKSGDAKGAKGFVTGKHGICEHVLMYFPPDALDKLAIDDKIAVRASGQGLALSDYPDITLRSMSPALLDRMNIREDIGKLKVGVAKIVPACIMGSGLGWVDSATGDYDITLFDEEIKVAYNLKDLRFGDIVAIMDADTRYGRAFRAGAVTIGVVIHGDSFLAGHGPGVTTLMSCKTPLIEPFLDSGANLANYFL